MYLPIKKLFEAKDYIVKGEVKSTDITAVKGDEIIIVEMKMLLTFKLLYQALNRQRLSDNVFIAIPKPPYKKLIGKSFKEKEFILRRLHLGLILVDMENDIAQVRFFPKVFDVKLSQAKSKKKKNQLIEEFNNRKSNSNFGGTSRTKIVTAYKERVIKLAHYLKEEPKSTKELRILTSDKQVANLLQKNYYGWFQRVDRGIYTITEVGSKEIIEFKELINQLLKN